MAQVNARASLRTRTLGPQRVKLGSDENATSRHVRQTSGVAGTAGGIVKGGIITKAGLQRSALGEVTTTAINRKDANNKLSGKEKNGIEPLTKRSRSSSVNGSAGLQRVPLGPGRAQAVPPVAAPVNARAPVGRAQRVPIASNIVTTVVAKRLSIATSVSQTAITTVLEEERLGEEHHFQLDIDENSMDVEVADAVVIAHEQEVEEMVGVHDDEEEIMSDDVAEPQAMWPEMSMKHALQHQRDIDRVRSTFKDDLDIFDTTMVSEYAEEIFEYMTELEEGMMPSPDYMDGQNEITWAMRQTLVDWLLQVHVRYQMLPETLWIAVNIVDRFLTKRVVSLVKLQLVGVTALFIAAKYEEILAPGVEEFVFITENGYTKEEILKGERIMLQTLEFHVSHYCSPYSWMRKISKADEYDIQTRTLGKFLTEVTILDYRFLRVKPSLIAAVGMYTARRMLGGDWNDAFVYYSGFMEEHLMPGFQWLVDKLLEDGFSKMYVSQKYASRKFLKASIFAIEWARVHGSGQGAGEVNGMIL